MELEVHHDANSDFPLQIDPRKFIWELVDLSVALRPQLQKLNFSTFRTFFWMFLLFFYVIFAPLDGMLPNWPNRKKGEGEGERPKQKHQKEK